MGCLITRPSNKMSQILEEAQHLTCRGQLVVYTNQLGPPQCRVLQGVVFRSKLNMAMRIIGKFWNRQEVVCKFRYTEGIVQGKLRRECNSAHMGNGDSVSIWKSKQGFNGGRFV